MMANNHNTKGAQSQVSLKSLKIRSSYAHLIVTPTDKFWCDATKCELCPIRFKCFTTEDSKLETTCSGVMRWKLW